MFQKIVQLLILVGTAALVYYTRITDAYGQFSLATITFRSDFMFLAAVVVGAIAHILNSLRLSRVHRQDFSKLAGAAFLLQWFFFAFGIFATLYANVSSDLWFDQVGFANFGKMLLGIALGMVTYESLQRDMGFYKWVARALFISPVLPLTLGILSMISPSALGSLFGGVFSVGRSYAIFGPGQRFQGLTTNPFQAVINSFVAVSFVWVMAWYNLMHRKRLIGVVQVLYVLGLVLLIFWSLTRTGLIVLAFVLLLGSFFASYYLAGRKDVPRVLPTVSVALVVVGIAWALLPQDTVSLLVERFGVVSGRLVLWRYYLDVALANPLGVGFNYEQVFFLPRPGYFLNPHNSVLVAWMYGGVGAVLCMLLLLGVILRSIRLGLRRARDASAVSCYYVGAVTALLGYWVLTIFLGVPIGDYTHSLLLALVLSSGLHSLRALPVAERSESPQVVKARLS